MLDPGVSLRSSWGLRLYCMMSPLPQHCLHFGVLSCAQGQIPLWVIECRPQIKLDDYSEHPTLCTWDPWSDWGADRTAAALTLGIILSKVSEWAASGGTKPSNCSALLRFKSTLVPSRSQGPCGLEYPLKSMICSHHFHQAWLVPNVAWRVNKRMEIYKSPSPSGRHSNHKIPTLNWRQWS